MPNARWISYLALACALSCGLLLAGCQEPPKQQRQAASPPPASSSAPAAPATPPSAAAPPATAPVTPPPDVPTPAASGNSKVLGEGQVRHLPPDLLVNEYSGEGITLEIYPTTATPRAGRGDPAEISFTAVLQRAVGDFDVASWKTTLPQNVTKTMKVGKWKLAITPRTHPQHNGTRLPSGEIPLVHDGFLDLTLSDDKGRPLGRFSVSDDGWVSFAPDNLQPPGTLTTAIREGEAGTTWLDMTPLAGGAPLLRVESYVSGGDAEQDVTAKDGDVNQFHFPHAVLRFLSPGMFKTTAEIRGAEAYPRNPQ